MWKIIRLIKWLELYKLWLRMVPQEHDLIIEQARKIVASPL